MTGLAKGSGPSPPNIFRQFFQDFAATRSPVVRRFGDPPVGEDSGRLCRAKTASELGWRFDEWQQRFPPLAEPIAVLGAVERPVRPRRP
jgi:hypothetical protein